MTEIDVTLTLHKNGNEQITKWDIQVQLDALQRLMEGKTQGLDSGHIIDVKSILTGIMEKLPK